MRMRSGIHSRLSTPAIAGRVAAICKGPPAVLGAAAIAALCCGIAVSTQSLIVFTAIAVVLALGIGLPQLMVRQVDAAVCFQAKLVEGDVGTIRIRVRNCGFFPLEQLRFVSLEDSICTDAISMRPFEEREIRLQWAPAARGSYPRSTIEIVCAFPLNIWSARRRVAVAVPGLVWPRANPVGVALHDLADRRGFESAEPNGDLRPYRRGDSMRLIHSMQSARHDRLIVREPERAGNLTLSIHLDRSCNCYPASSDGINSVWEAAVRTAAGLVSEAVAQHWNVCLELGMHSGEQRIACNDRSIARAMDALATIALSDRPRDDQSRGGADRGSLAIVITSIAGACDATSGWGHAAVIAVPDPEQGRPRLIPARARTWRSLAGTAS